MINLLIYPLIAIAIICLIYTVLSIVLDSWYDVLAIKRIRRLRKKPNGKWFRHRPSVTVLIPAFNEEQLIERCVRSVLKSSYRKYQVVVIDDHSTDNTAKIVRVLAEEFPQKDIRVIKKRKNQGKGAALNTGLRYAKGEVILTIDADGMADRYAIQRAVRYFVDPSVQVVTGNVRIKPSDSILGLLQQIEFLCGFRNKKFNQVANCEYIAGGTSSFYRRRIISKAGGFRSDMQAEDIALSLAIASLGNKANRIIYANDALFYTEAVPTYKGLIKQRYRWKMGSLQAIYLHRNLVFSLSSSYSKMFSWLRMPHAIWSEVMLIFEPFAFVFFLYAAFYWQSTSFYIGAALTLIGMILIHIWGDEYYSLREKIEFSVITPAVYPLFFVMSSVQLLSVIKVIKNYKVIFGKTKITGNWVSPGRLAEINS